MQGVMLNRLLVLGAFAGVVGWFQLAQPYEHYFTAASPLQLIIHLLARVSLSLFLLLMVSGFGKLALRVLDRSQVLVLSTMESFILQCLMGLAVLRILMLLLGFASLYYLWVMLPIALLGLWHGAPYLSCRLPFSKSADALQLHAAQLLLLAIAGLVIAAKMLYPLADPDYLGHYLAYYQEVLFHHSLLPGDMWNHFYTSRGAGEVFFVMLLSDALAPFAVSASVFVLMLMMASSLGTRLTGDRLSGILAAIMATVPLAIVVPGVAEFSKQHFLGGALMLGMVWLSVLAFQLPQRALGFALCLQVMSLALFRPTFAAIAASYLLLMALCALATRHRSALRSHLAAAMVAIVAAPLILLGNYLFTGFADITPFRLFIGMADQEKFARWCSPFLLMLVDLGTSTPLGSVALPAADRLATAWRMLRMHELAQYLQLGGMLYAVALAAGIFSLRRSHRPILQWSAASVPMFLAAAAVACLFIRQDDSLWRVYVFCLFFVALLGALPLGLLRHAASAGIRRLMGIAMLLIAFLGVSNAFSDMPNRHWRAMSRLLQGELTLADIYQTHEMYSPALGEACAQVPPGKIVWASRQFAAPGCRVQSFYAFSMGPEWHIITFDIAPHAKAALQRHGIDYFLIDTNEAFLDTLPHAPLFSPQNISRHLGVVWQRDGIYLLTWREQAAAELPSAFFAPYARSVVRGGKFADMGAIHRIIHGEFLRWMQDTQRWPVAVPQGIPRPTGWQ